MSLIDSTYFKSDINIPLSEYQTTVFAAFIAEKEKEFLVGILGYDLYKLVAAYDATKPEETEQIYRDIIEGKEYTIGGYTCRWNGLINTEKVSPIAYYIYYWWMRNNSSETTTTGEIENKHENAVLVPMVIKMQNAWTKLLRLMGEYSNVTDNYHSFRTFMYNHFSSYPKWMYSRLGTINMFDL